MHGRWAVETMSSDQNSTSVHGGARSVAVLAVERLAVRARALRIVAACGALVILVVAAVSGTAAIDALVRFPAPIRAAILLAIVVLVAVDVRKFLVPALRFRPRPIEIAQRIERQRPELAGHLAAAVDFELTGVARTNELAAYAVRNLEDRARGMSFSGVLRLRPTALRALGAMACIGFVVGFAALEPAYASIAVRRVLTPWSNAAWPARTAVESLVADGLVAPKGAPVELRARLTKGDASSERVFVRYRVLSDAGTVMVPWTEVALSRQPTGEFERLVDAGGDRVEYAFVTRDAETEVRSIRLVEPPKVVEAKAWVTAPEYARRVVETREVQLGDGTDARSTLRDPILDGSVVRIELRLSRAIAVDASKPAVWMLGSAAEQGRGLVAEANPQPQAADPAKAVGGTGAAGESKAKQGAIAAAGARRALVPKVDGTDLQRWTVEFVVRGPVRVETQLVDADGIRQNEPAQFVLDSIVDRAPTAAIVEPMQDESIVADARVAMRAECRDDLELKRSGIEIATKLGKAETESLVFEENATLDGPQAGSALERVLEVAKLGLAAGDSVVLRAFAEDYFDGLGAPADSHPRARSAPRVLRIVGEEEFERQIRSTLAGVRRDAMRSDERQSKAREKLEKDLADPELGPAQVSVTEGLSRMRESAEQAIARLERNGRMEGSLADLARQAQDIAAAAESRSAEAGEAIERAQRDAKTAAEREERAAEAKQAAEMQEEVRAELEDLIGLLDRDEDAWVARRKLEGLTNRIRQLARETQQAAQRAGGESREELPPESRAELDELAQRQAKAADEAEKTIAEMKERGKMLAQSDQQQSQALDAAAKAAEEGQVREEMDQASKDTAQNKLEQAKAAQDRAVEALQKAAQALQEDRKVRAKELARMMEDLVRSIKRLIEETEASKALLARAEEGKDARETMSRDPLAGEFGKLSQNTRGVAADARARSREAARAARSLDSAAVSMAAVAAKLRSDQFARADALAAADAALKYLDDALKQADEAAQRAEDRAAQEKRDELLAKYREFLERQSVIREAVRKIVPEAGKSLGRRELVESRRLGTTQEELRDAIRATADTVEEVKSSDALVDIHGAIDQALAGSRASLAEGNPASSIPRQDDAIEALSAIVSALDENSAPGDEDMFAEKQSQESGEGGGGQSSGGAVPPAAEVKLLRSMQDALAKRTRSLDEGTAALGPSERVLRLEELAAKQRRILELGSKLAEKIRGGSSAPTSDTRNVSDGKQGGGASDSPPPGKEKP